MMRVCNGMCDGEGIACMCIMACVMERGYYVCLCYNVCDGDGVQCTGTFTNGITAIYV